MKPHFAWGISTGEGNLIGVYWFTKGEPLEPWHDGFRIALFETRSIARYYKSKFVKGPKDRGKYPRATVVKVKIDLSHRVGIMETRRLMKRWQAQRDKDIRSGKKRNG